MTGPGAKSRVWLGLALLLAGASTLWADDGVVAIIGDQPVQRA
ncbi:MAG: hypothetical protein OXC31_17095 [Spirochaetaceae bacterium]|nr:hypothetical protein [Spirochaetaceae bacterium]